MTIERPMFPPVDPTRRRLLTIAAAGSIAGLIPTIASALPDDPIYAALDAFRFAEAAFYAERSGDIPDEIGDRWSDAMDVVIRT
jgi:hypothetical protein